MWKEKRIDDCPEEDSALNSGRLVPTPDEEIYLQRANDFQRQEGVATGVQDSDPPIVVRDGNTVHTAKERAERQRGQSTHARDKNTPDQSVSSTLSALRAKADADPGHRFRALARLLDRQMLGEAFACLKRKAAPGIDGVSHAEYAENLAEEKSSLVKFNRWEPDDSGKFTFLGFDFYWARTKRNPKTMVVKRRTNRKKFQASVLALKEWIKRARSLKLRELLTALRRKLRGYWNYYGVPTSIDKI